MSMIIGRIYELYLDGLDETYVGATTVSLNQRMALHRFQAKQFNEGKIPNCCNSAILFCLENEETPVKMRCLEEMIVEDKYDPKLRECEQKYIDERPLCVNSRSAFVTHEQQAENARQNAKKFYYENIEIAKKRNLDNYYKNIEARRAYYQANKEKYKEKYQNKYKTNHTKEQARIYNQTYKEKHKDTLTAITDCECGKKVKGVSLKAHLKSKYHCSRVKTNSLLTSNENPTFLCEEVVQSEEETDCDLSC